MSTIIIDQVIPGVTKEIVVKVDGKSVVFDVSELYTSEDVYVHVTPLFQAFGRAVSDYTRSKRAKSLRGAFKSRYGKNAYLTESGTYESNGRTEGTWLHAWLVPDALRYLSPEFSLAVDEVLRALVAREHERVAVRSYLRIEHGKVSDAVHDYWQRVYGQAPESKVYAAFQNAANIRATGMTAHQLKATRSTDETRSRMTEAETKALQKVHERGMTLMDANLPFEDVLRLMKGI